MNNVAMNVPVQIFCMAICFLLGFAGLYGDCVSSLLRSVKLFPKWLQHCTVPTNKSRNLLQNSVKYCTKLLFLFFVLK